MRAFFILVAEHCDWTLATQAGSQLIITSHVMFYCQGGNVYANSLAPAVTQSWLLIGL